MQRPVFTSWPLDEWELIDYENSNHQLHKHQTRLSFSHSPCLIWFPLSHPRFSRRPTIYVVHTYIYTKGEWVRNIRVTTKRMRPDGRSCSMLFFRPSPITFSQFYMFDKCPHAAVMCHVVRDMSPSIHAESGSCSISAPASFRLLFFWKLVRRGVCVLSMSYGIVCFTIWMYEPNNS